MFGLIMNKKNAGFTLVELLIVIIIIAILAGMALMNIGSAISMAEATKIINDVRMMHSALISYYIDNDGLPPVASNGSVTPLSAQEVKSISVYMDRNLDSTRYDAVYLTRGPSASDSRILLGVRYLAGASAKLADVNKYLGRMAFGSGLCDPDGSIFQPTGTTDTVYIWLM